MKYCRYWYLTIRQSIKGRIMNFTNSHHITLTLAALYAQMQNNVILKIFTAVLKIFKNSQNSHDCPQAHRLFLQALPGYEYIWPLILPGIRSLQKRFPNLEISAAQNVEPNINF